MRVYRSGVFHCLVGGFSFAAALEVRERFHEQVPAVFYSIHGLFVLLAVAWVIVLVRKEVVPLGRAARDGLLIACCYGMAATGSVVALYAIPAVAVFAFVMMKRGVGFGVGAQSAEGDA
ncbi:hypothetical protein [Actinomyces culturomici]|uniref:hypothetical protein n=1 Tax=Actinomyces culturomici TaxID=1926276 RepID=UPI00135B1C23|nr:hypothetical protein [Actinomyces culturomici]